MTQSETILGHLQRGKPITPIQALNKYGVFRLAARIADLKREGHQIQTRMVEKNGKRYAAYWM